MWRGRINLGLVVFHFHSVGPRPIRGRKAKGVGQSDNKNAGQPTIFDFSTKIHHHVIMSMNGVAFAASSRQFAIYF